MRLTPRLGARHGRDVDERIAEPDAGASYPACLTGRRAAPPEDCGGPWGYAHLLEALADPEDPDHAEMLDWAGEIDPEAFDAEAIDTQLRRLR